MDHWIYHPNFPAKIVTSAEYPVFLREGWFDTPAKFNDKPAEVPHETSVETIPVVTEEKVEDAPRRRGRPPASGLVSGDA